MSRDPAQLWEAGSGGAGQDHKTRDVISFCKGRLRPKRRVDLPGAPPAPSPQGQGSRGAAPRRVIPPPTPLHTRRLVCTRHSPVYTSVHPLSSRFASHIPPCIHAHSRWSTTPTQHHSSPHLYLRMRNSRVMYPCFQGQWEHCSPSPLGSPTWSSQQAPRSSVTSLPTALHSLIA